MRLRRKILRFAQDDKVDVGTGLPISLWYDYHTLRTPQEGCPYVYFSGGISKKLYRTSKTSGGSKSPPYGVRQKPWGIATGLKALAMTADPGVDTLGGKAYNMEEYLWNPGV